jgi:phosphoribosylaminoimidazole-succinocarboxamide synthase
MRTLAEAAPHHLVSDDPHTFPSPYREHAEVLAGRAQLVRRAERIDIECVVRGYLTGSGWKEYKASGTVCGLPLPAGLHDGSRLSPAIFTPATKNDVGHDENISFEQMSDITGRETALALRERSLAI